jgi:nucleotide-binding universal stress UspA family protein
MSLKTVLLAVGDGDRDRIDSLAQLAVDVAGPAGATVALAHVFAKEEYDDIRERLEFGPDSEATPDEVAKRYLSIRELGDAMDEHDVEFSWHGRLSNGTTEGERIVDLAEEIGADLVVVGGRKRSPAGKALFGSTAQEVLLNAPCPVTLVRDE